MRQAPARPLNGLHVRSHGHLQSGFFLAFGADAIWVYHLLRWQRFCSDPRWLEIMVAAVNGFREIFGATDAVATWDCSRIIGEFHSGVSFDRALKTAISEGEVEVERPPCGKHELQSTKHIRRTKNMR